MVVCLTKAARYFLLYLFYNIVNQVCLEVLAILV